MADQPRTLDVWLVEANKVYRDVPYTVVADWTQQNRLVADDRVRTAGGEWQRVADSAFAAYLPKPEPHQAEDRAEALEPVEAGFNWKRPSEDGDDDVDMIPLIDVSLVLLIFFMLTATAVPSIGSSAGLPPADFGAVTDPAGGLWVRIDLDGKGKDRTPVYSVGRGGKSAAPEDRDLHSVDEVMPRLDALLPTDGSPVELTVNAQGEVEAGVVRQLVIRLEEGGRRLKITHKYTGVSRKQP